jgi:DNA-binding protein Fis
MSLQNQFQRLHGYDVAEFYKWEATTAIELPWLGEKPNMTLQNRMLQNDPQLHTIVKSSIEVAKQWASEIFEEARVQQTDAESILGITRKAA